VITYSNVSYDTILKPLAALFDAEFKKIAPAVVAEQVPTRTERWFELTLVADTLLTDTAHGQEREYQVRVRHWRKSGGEEGLCGMDAVLETVERAKRLLWNNRVNATTGWYAGQVESVDHEPPVEAKGFRAVDINWTVRYHEAIS